MRIEVDVIPANVFNELMDNEAIPMNDLVEQLTMSMDYTKLRLSENSKEELKKLVEYIYESDAE